MNMKIKANILKFLTIFVSMIFTGDENEMFIKLFIIYKMLSSYDYKSTMVMIFIELGVQEVQNKTSVSINIINS